MMLDFQLKFVGFAVEESIECFSMDEMEKFHGVSYHVFWGLSDNKNLAKLINRKNIKNDAKIRS